MSHAALKLLLHRNGVTRGRGVLRVLSFSPSQGHQETIADIA